MSNNNSLTRSHDHNLEKAAAYAELARLCGDTESLHFATALRTSIDDSITVMDRVRNNSSQLKALKQAFKDEDAKLKATVTGIYAIVEGTDRELFAKLPPREAWSDIAGAQQAERLHTALLAAGKDGKHYAAQLATVMKMREHAEKTWITAGKTPAVYRAGDHATAKLRSLISQVDVYLRGVIEPGTPMFDLLKKARKAGSRPKPAKKEKKATEKKSGDNAPPAAPEHRTEGSTTQPPLPQHGGGGEAGTTATPPPAPAHPGSSSEVALVSANGAAPSTLNGALA